MSLKAMASCAARGFIAVHTVGAGMSTCSTSPARFALGLTILRRVAEKVALITSCDVVVISHSVGLVSDVHQATVDYQSSATRGQRNDRVSKGYVFGLEPDDDWSR